MLDTAAESVQNTPIVLFSNNENDMTDAVLAQLNAGAPADASKPDDKGAAKTGDKKKDKK